MSILDSTSILLKPLGWTQTISNLSPVDPPGLSMRTACLCVTRRDLQLSTDEPFAGLHLSVALVDGPPLIGQPARTIERGIGLFTYLPATDESFSCISGWFSLPSPHYRELWQQVSHGAFTDCEIALDIAPLRLQTAFAFWDVGQNPSLFILGAAVRFTHRERRAP